MTSGTHGAVRGAARGARPSLGSRPPYGPLVHPTPPPVLRRRPPVLAMLAATLAVLSAIVVAFFGFIALAFSGGDLSGGGGLLVAVPALLSMVLVAGAFLLLRGRSWLALTLPAGALSLTVIAAVLYGTLGDGTGGALLLAWALPGISAVLAALPGVRRWVAERNQARRAG
ncbi:MAG: rane protein of unknown function [Modestobacter sp.]|nr:rane protein of unknown function [Modestobacter sp.]